LLETTMSQAPTQSFDPSMASALASRLREQQGALREALERGTAKLKRSAVHDLRVAVRRLESTIELAKAIGGKPRKRLVRRLDELLDALSPLRDVHVAARAVETLPPTPQGQKQLGRHVAKQKRRLEPEVEQSLEDFKLEAVGRDLDELSQSLRALEHVEGSEPDSALRLKLDRLRARIEGTRSSASAEAPKSLHRLRIAIKRYRYALEALGQCLPPELLEGMRTAESLQKQLGQAHDAHQLAKLAQSCAKKHPQVRPLANALRRESATAQRVGADASAKVRLG
jgi:CHAD domain-containing protein